MDIEKFCTSIEQRFLEYLERAKKEDAERRLKGGNGKMIQTNNITIPKSLVQSAREELERTLEPGLYAEVCKLLRSYELPLVNANGMPYDSDILYVGRGNWCLRRSYLERKIARQQ